MSILKRSLRGTLCCLTLLALFTCTTLLQADVITIPDANLRSAIEDALGLNSGEPISTQQMAALTFLYGADIEDFTGLEKAVNLSALTMWNCNLSDLSPISKISKLRYLELRNCQLTDLSPLSNLKYLYDLILPDNQISDLSGLSGLRNLSNLSLSNNLISDLTPLSNLTGLKKLFLNQNLISDISPLASLTGLNNLIIKDNHMYLLEEQNLQTYRTLREADVRITYNPQYLPGIREPMDTVKLLAAPGDTVTHSFIIYSSGTATLEFELNTEYDWITADMYSGTLEAGQQIEVELTIGEIPEYTGSLSAMISITSNDPSDPIVEFPIEISYQVDIPDAVLRAEIESALGLEPGAPVSSVEMVTLSRLDAIQRGIQDLTGLESAINLRKLKLAYKFIYDISALSVLQHLTYLELSGNQISDISPLIDLSNLQYLYLSENQLTDISILENLPNLQELHLQNNHLFIADGSPAQAVISSLEQAGVVIEYEPQLIPSILVDNDTITLAGSPGDTFSTVLKISNSGTDDLTYSFAFSSDWITTSPDSGTIDPGNSADVELILSDLPSFNDVLNAELSITSNDPGTPVNDVQIEIFPPIEIQDPNLRSVLEEALGLDQGSRIIQAQLDTLISLDASGLGISGLSGIEHCQNLSILSLNNNQLTDISLLENLANLQELHLQNNHLYIADGSSAEAVISSLEQAGVVIEYEPQLIPSIFVDNDTITLAGSPGDTFSTVLEISNSGTDDLTYSVSSDSAWITTSSASSTIDPGNSADVELILSDLPSFNDVLNAGLSITSNDPDTPVIDVQIEIYPPIDIPDANLRSVLEEAIDLESGTPIIAPQLANLTELDASDRNIVDLSGIEYAVNLVSLDLGSNLITDLDPLQSLSSLEYLNVRMNLLDIRSESDDWQVLKQIDAYADVHYDPQRYPMRNFEDFLVDHSIPEGLDGHLDKNGPLNIPNLMAFAMGIDPMTATFEMLPQAVRDEEAGSCSFCFYRNLAAMDVDLLIESSTDMATWAPVSPEELNILSDDGDGQQYVEAIFEEEERILFRVRAVPDGQ